MFTCTDPPVTAPRFECPTSTNDNTNINNMKFSNLQSSAVKEQEKRLEKTKKDIQTRHIKLEKLRH
jgi:hypothetical protein